MSEPIRAVERALDVLACFQQGRLALSLTQIADEIEIPKSTVFRLLATLETKRFIHRDPPTGLYHLGLRFIEMGALAAQDLDVQTWALPYLHRLAAACGETVDLAILDGINVIYLQVVESDQRIRLAAAVGQRLPAFCTASGKAFLAYLPEMQVRKILTAGMPKYTENTRISQIDMWQDLQDTRRRGFSISEGEYENDIHAIGAPVLTAAQYPVLTVAVAGPSFRLPRERMLALGPSLRAVTDAMAQEAGRTALSAMTALPQLPGPAGLAQERYL